MSLLASSKIFQYYRLRKWEHHALNYLKPRPEDFSKRVATGAPWGSIAAFFAAMLVFGLDFTAGVMGQAKRLMTDSAENKDEKEEKRVQMEKTAWALSQSAQARDAKTLRQ